ncbi:glycoside hydrolase family 25 protein [Wolbachia endosymbiont (group B) of Cyclophora punctaria]|uniref:glycoside hydrolase family 25 protein n=1 Tax=Wolbachia endosymbiont (group B) of Cyclophora punctaria TaxID=3066168 RepID=UPI00333F348E
MSEKGIDVSHWNGEIDWSKVAKDRVRFAFAKATEGETSQDTKFGQNFQSMKDNNVQAGAYHVFRMTSTPEGQLNNIVNELKKANFEPGTNKLAVSATTGICEGRTTKCDDPTKHTNTQRAEKLHSLLTQLNEKGYSPIVYASPKTWNDYYTQEEHNFSHYPLWVADWRGRSEPELPKDWKDAGKNYTYWNYTSQGEVDGTEGQVPLDQTF